MLTSVNASSAFAQLTDAATAEQIRNTTADKDAGPAEKTVAAITAQVRDSIVVIRQLTSDGESRAIGSGFVISEDGLIATNLHVIGEARPIRVETRAGKKYRVVEIHASERQMDLAILRVAEPTDLKPLSLADNRLRQGDSIIAIGHPQGLEHSVVEGLMSARKKIDGKPMLQLSMPIEQGNSGGPVLDRQGRVHGIVSLKSIAADNTGFAIETSALKRLIENPNPVTIDHWLAIQELDIKTWEPLFDANWRQRVDRVLVDGTGAGFGGRSLCLRREESGESPFELSVDVRLDDESGAAGLVIHSDGGNKHYGYYPSTGRIRFTRFDGPDVYSWNVLHEVECDAYRPGEWNSLRVVLTDKQMKCYVNNTLVITSTDQRYTSGRVGLAKFRQTRAEFRKFRVVPLVAPQTESLTKLIGRLPTEAESPTSDFVDDLARDAGITGMMLEERARKLDDQAAELRELSARLNTRRVQQRLVAELGKPNQQINLLRATLLLSQLDNPDLDIPVYEREVERMAEQIRDQLGDDADESRRIQQLNQFLFKEHGFHGNRFEYYTRSNSYINEVVYNRQGLPITLSVLYIELAQRIGLNVVGVGLPGHYVVRWEPQETAASTKAVGKEDDTTKTTPTDPKTDSDNTDSEKHPVATKQLIDPFDRGKAISREQAEVMIKTAGFKVSESFFASQTKRQIISRMFSNLIGLAERSRDTDRLIRYMDTLVQLFPDEAEFRARRVDLRFRSGEIDGAISDIDWFLNHKPAGIEIEKLKDFRVYLESRR